MPRSLQAEAEHRAAGPWTGARGAGAASPQSPSRPALLPADSAATAENPTFAERPSGAVPMLAAFPNTAKSPALKPGPRPLHCSPDS